VSQQEKLELLAHYFPDIAPDIQKLSAICKSNHSTRQAILQASILIEKMVRRIYDAVIDDRRGNNHIQFFDVLQLLKERREINDEIYSCLHVSRVFGNAIRHSGNGAFTLEHESLILQILIIFLDWHLGVYSDCPGTLATLPQKSKTILLWTDMSEASAVKLCNYIEREAIFSEQIKVLKSPDEILRHQTDDTYIFVLIVTDTTKLSENYTLRKLINEKIELTVRNGGVVIGAHDLIYRRCRNDDLEKVFGCQLNGFKRIDSPVEYRKASFTDNFASLRHLDDVLMLNDGEICWGDWAPGSNILFYSPDEIPLVVAREYGKGYCIWINSGDYRDFPPLSIEQPEKGFVTLLSSLIMTAAHREWEGIDC
jgi:hypothetical protein